MTTLQIYLNNHLVDLSDDSPLALTFQINNLAEVKNQQGNTSNQFKLPLTQRNRRILGFPDEVAFTDEKPYLQYQAKIIQDGLEIIPYGIAELNGIDEDTAAITILSGNVDFFDAIDGKIYDLGNSATPLGRMELMKNYQADWTLDNVVASQSRTDGWIWPIVDYGAIPENFEGTPDIDVRYLRPGFFLKTAIELMVRSTGYQIDPDCFLMKDKLYPELLVQFANDEFSHGTDYQSDLNDPLSCQVRTGSDQSFGQVSVYEDNLFFGDLSRSNGLWYGGDNSYRATTSVSATVTFTFSADVYGDPRNKNDEGETIGMRLEMRMYNASGNVVLTSAYVDLSTNAQEIAPRFFKYEARDVKLSYDIDLAEDEHIYIHYFVTNNRKGTIVIKQGATLTITSKKQNVLYGQQIQCERIFPDISMKDLLKDTLQRFGIICQTNNTKRTINLASLRDIVNNIPSAKNWSKKCVNQGKSITFQLGGYAQINNLKYKQDDNVLPPYLADSVIKVADKTLPANADLFESQFAPTLNRPYIGGTIAQIQKIDPSDEAKAFATSTQPRILINERRSLNGRSVRFVDGTGRQSVINGVISTPYFDKPGGKYSLTFDYLRKTYYPELEKILYRSKKVVRYFMLTPRDILELDLLIPVFLEQDSAYYYINKIDAWRKGQPTKVELVKLG